MTRRREIIAPISVIAGDTIDIKDKEEYIKIHIDIIRITWSWRRRSIQVTLGGWVILEVE